MGPPRARRSRRGALVPRAAAGLLRQNWALPRTVAQFAARWRTEILAARELGQRAGEPYLELRYEDLVAEPEQEMRRVCEYALSAVGAGDARRTRASSTSRTCRSTTPRAAADPERPRLARREPRRRVAPSRWSPASCSTPATSCSSRRRATPRRRPRELARFAASAGAGTRGPRSTAFAALATFASDRLI